MPKISNVYLDKKRKTWYFVASLGFDESGKRLQHWERGFKTQKEAKDAYDRYMNDFSKSAVKINSTMSYKEFYDTYFEPDYKRSVKKRTYENRISSMRIHFAYFYNTKLKDINAPMMKKWQNSLAENYSNAYIRNIYGLFQKSLDLAVKLGLLNKNVAKQVGNVKKQKKKIDFWTQNEFEKVISTFDISDYYEHYTFIIIWLLFMTGLRLGEAQALEWTDIDFENKIIHVNGTLKYIAKAKVKYMIDEPKSESSKRDILMLDNLVTVLREHRKRQLATRMLLGDKWRPEPGFENLVFTGSFGRCISENALYQDMKKIIVQIREDGHTFGEHTPHSLRHTFATRGFERGIPPKVMQEILGHKSITMTLDIYSHVLPDKKAEEINKLAAMF